MGRVGIAWKRIPYVCPIYWGTMVRVPFCIAVFARMDVLLIQKGQLL